MTSPIAIIGAGVAGLAAAGVLRSAGVPCVLFDKGRGIGGRIATRRVDGLRFDHGARFFSAERPRFRAVVDQWCAVVVAARWFDGFFVGTPGMSAPMRTLAAGHTVIGGCMVAGLRRDDTGWSLRTEDGLVDAPGNGTFSAVLLALPAPQIAPLAGFAGVAFPELARVLYAPCWTLMLAFREPLGSMPDRLVPDGGPIAWIGRDGAKPGRDPNKETLVVHATADWSRANLERSKDEVTADLWAAVRDATGLRNEPYHADSHRWRHALVERAAGSPFLWDDGRHVGACGDWCLGSGVEAAFDSGEALALAVLDRLEIGHAA